MCCSVSYSNSHHLENTVIYAFGMHVTAMKWDETHSSLPWKRRVCFGRWLAHVFGDPAVVVAHSRVHPWPERLGTAVSPADDTEEDHAIVHTADQRTPGVSLLHIEAHQINSIQFYL